MSTEELFEKWLRPIYGDPKYRVMFSEYNENDMEEAFLAGLVAGEKQAQQAMLNRLLTVKEGLE